MSYVVAVIGATGNVGREMLNILAERNFPVARVDAVASRRSQGKEVSFGDKTLKCQALEFYEFAAADIALFACGSGPAEEYAPKAAAAGCVHRLSHQGALRASVGLDGAGLYDAGKPSLPTRRWRRVRWREHCTAWARRRTLSAGLVTPHARVLCGAGCRASPRRYRRRRVGGRRRFSPSRSAYDPWTILSWRSR